MTIELTYRERFARTVAHQDVDRPPMDLGSTDMTEIDGGIRRLAPLLGLPAGGSDAFVGGSDAFVGGSDADRDEAVLRALDTDIRGVGHILVPANTPIRHVSATELIDPWGITYRFNGHHYEAVGRPLAGATIDDLAKFPWPDPETIDPQEIAQIRERARYLYEETPYVVCARHPFFGVMELGCWMCGFDDFLFRMAADQEFVHRFFEILLTYQRRVTEIYYGAVGPYIHFTTSGDDFGTQTGPFISPAMFRDLVKPFFAERIRTIKRHTNAVFFHHTCGSVYSLLPDLIDAGVEILNPIQPRVTYMEPARLKREFGDRLTFYGGVDTQELLPRGTPEEVYEATRALIATLAPGGGYILSAAHTIQPDVPLENVVAMYRAGKAGL